MKIAIPKYVKTTKVMKTKTFNCPEGNFRGRFCEVKPVQARDPADPRIRLMFETDVPELIEQQVMTRKDLPPDLRPGSPLRRFLEQWLGEACFNNQEELDFDQLIGKETDLSIVHFHNPKYSNPYCDIKGAFPAGTLVQTLSQPGTTTTSSSQGEGTIRSVASLLDQHTTVSPFAGPYCRRDLAQFAAMMKELAKET
jgi:hypothetical protein